MKLVVDEVGLVSLETIPIGKLFKHKEIMYIKTDKIRTTPILGETDDVLCVAIVTGRTTHFIIDLLVNKVEQCEAVHVKVIY